MSRWASSQKGDDPTEKRAYYECTLGWLEICCTSHHVTRIRRVDTPGTDHLPSPLSDLAAAQLWEYLCGTRTAFDFPISPSGTPFQKAVWKALQEIPYGKTRTYGQIAAVIGSPGAARAVGMACNRNPIWIVIPCHRVIGGNRSLTGYAGGLDMKRRLLLLESGSDENTPRKT